VDDKLIIEGIEGYNGDYPLDLSYFTMRELATLKRLSGVRAGEIDEAFAAGDTDAIVAIAVIMLQRATGNTIDEERLWDARAGAIRFEAGDAAIPPAPTPVEPSGHTGSSGGGSSTSTAPPVSDPSRTGSQPLAIGATSPLVTSPG
jgi:hypothetical protein